MCKIASLISASLVALSGSLCVSTSAMAEFDAGLLIPGCRVEASSRQPAHPETNALDADDSSYWQPSYDGGSCLVRTFEVPLDIDRIEFDANGVSSYSVEAADYPDMIFKQVVSNENVSGSKVIKQLARPIRARSIKVTFNGNWPRIYSLRLYSNTSTDEQALRRENMRKDAPFVAVMMSGHWMARPGREQFAAAFDDLRWPWARFSPEDVSTLESRLGDYDILVLDTFYTLSKEHAKAIRHFVDEGGIVLVFDASVPERYEWLAALDPDLAVTAGRYAADGSPDCGLDIIPTAKPFASILKSKTSLDGNGTHFVTYGKAWHKVIVDHQDYPVMLTSSVGKGFVLATTLRSDNLPVERILSGLDQAVSVKLPEPEHKTPWPAAIQTKSTVAPGSERRLVVNGKPFFPIGIYRAPASLLREFASYGFNTVVHEYKPPREYLDAALGAGLKVCPIVWDDLDYMKKNMDHPSILTWYMSDEPGGRSIEDPRQDIKACEDFRSIDPAHPTFIVDNYPNEHVRAADIIALDIYPISYSPETLTSWPMWEIARKFRQVQADPMLKHKELWVIPQACGNYPTLAMPTAKQERAMVYGSICLGAKGVLFYSWTVPERPGWDLGQESELWSAMKQTAAELKKLTPVLVSKERPVGIHAGHVSPDLLWMHKRLNGVDYIFASNWGTHQADGQFLFDDGRSGAVTDLIGTNRASVSRGVMCVSLAPLEVACFRVAEN